MKDIQNVIFDLGGVLINLDYHKTNKLLGELGLNNAFTKAQQIDIFDQLEEGKITQSEFIQAVNQVTNNTHDSDTIIKVWNSILLDLPSDRLELVKQVKQQYNTFLYSNTNEIHINEVYANTLQLYGVENFKNCFHEVYLSHEIGIRKPKVEGFKYIIEKNNLNPAETLFIDDSPQHVEGALKAGLKAEWLNLEQEDIAQLINRLNLLK